MAPDKNTRKEVLDEGLFRGTVLTKLEGIEDKLEKKDDEDQRQWDAMETERKERIESVEKVRGEVGRVKFYARIANGLLAITNGLMIWIGSKFGK